MTGIGSPFLRQSLMVFLKAPDIVRSPCRSTFPNTETTASNRPGSSSNALNEAISYDLCSFTGYLLVRAAAVATVVRGLNVVPDVTSAVLDGDDVIHGTIARVIAGGNPRNVLDRFLTDTTCPVVPQQDAAPRDALIVLRTLMESEEWMVL